MTLETPSLLTITRADAGVEAALPVIPPRGFEGMERNSRDAVPCNEAHS